MRRAVVMVALVAAAACSSKKAAPPPPAGSATGSASAAPSSEEARLAPMFDEVGDRIASDLRAAAVHAHKSRVGAAEALALATPASFYRYSDVLTKYGVTAEQLGKLASKDPDTMVHLVNRLVARTKDAEAALEKSLAGLPVTDPDDCLALVRRMIVVLRSKGPDHALAPILVPLYDQCTRVLPPRVQGCVGSATAEDFDACMATAR